MYPRLISCFVLTLLVSDHRCVAQVAQPPLTPEQYEGWAWPGTWLPWFQSLREYYRANPPGKPFLVKDPKDRLSIDADWSVRIDNHGILEHPKKGNGVAFCYARMPSICNYWAIWKAPPENKPVDDPESVDLHAEAYLSSASASLERRNETYVEYTCTFTGGPWHVGRVSLEAWYQYLGAAKVTGRDSDVAQCALHTANGGKYSDLVVGCGPVGEDLLWQAGLKAETKTLMYPVTIHLGPVQVNLVSNSGGDQVEIKGKGHRPRNSKFVPGSVLDPGIVYVRKHASVSTGAKKQWQSGRVGPGFSYLDFDCWFDGVLSAEVGALFNPK